MDTDGLKAVTTRAGEQNSDTIRRDAALGPPIVGHLLLLKDVEIHVETKVRVILQKTRHAAGQTLTLKEKAFKKVGGE